jgi:ABC-type polar amino acid transport system ATPase subunit
MLLKISGLEKKFGELAVLRGVDLEVEEGTVVCLVGSSGSGKSTLLRCINLLEQPSGGTIVFDGKTITDPKTQASEVRRHIGMVFQHFNLFPHLNVVRNVMEGPLAVLGISREEAREEALAQLEKVGLRDRAEEKPSRLSGGQQQRVAIARALAMRPRMMLFDEPTSALDPELVGEVLRVMKTLADEGMTMIVVTHEMSFAGRVANKIVMLDKGRIGEEGAPMEFLKSPKTERGKEFLSHFDWEHA